MIRGPHKDGSYSVRFYALDPSTGCPGGVCTMKAIPTHQVWINVMPTFEPSSSSFAVDGDEDGVDEIWVPLIEKAYVEYTARYWSSPDEYAYGFVALAALGWPATWNNTDGSVSSLYRVLSAANQGFPVLAGTEYPPSGFVQNHAYTVLGTAVVGYIPYVALRNPGGVLEPAGNGYDDGVFLLTLWEFQALFEYVDFPAEYSASGLLLRSRSDALAFFEDVAGVPERESD